MEEKYILAKWLEDDLSSKELDDFKQSQDFAIYHSIKEFSSQLQTKDFDEDKLLDKIKFIKNDSSKIIQIGQNWFFRIVALILISLGIFMFYQENNNTIEFAEKGDKSAFLLPDNSEITLNSESEIKYKKENWSKNRSLHLNGEAYFKVAKGKKFEVITDLGKVTVLGTQFNVKARNNRFDVICFEGKVKVSKNNKTLILKQGEKVSFEKSDMIFNKKTLESMPSWLETELFFEQEQFKNIIEEIERQYNITINHNLKTTNQLFTGKIPNNNVKIALEIIASTYRLKLIKNSNFQYELKNNE
ncbi:Iron dicitrate transport regulator FecR [Flavobacterium sp. 9AF]|uniref:FecR family protein n=1 Tax=Flavobacterium sp. 9AF TaxID=2653142 RepID=UPI0012EF919E|nr:FecR family protein [Flavobacterium sp. 9AF]VXB53907.1 Iron dicitrate transport regulator FecR [Flavobacterium sp. 9AF]